MAVTLLIPTLDEAKALPALVAHVAALDPQPAEVLLVDGGSGDETVAIARAAGWRVMTAERGRARQINAEVEAARSGLVCVLHADTQPPRDIVAEWNGYWPIRRWRWAGSPPSCAGREACEDSPASITGSRPGTRRCCCGRISTQRACGCCSAIPRCISAAPTISRQEAAIRGRR
ncbi:glycosyltransferase [Alteriqipengyuania flavescens]|uniref:glycosyltransferase n=1 Tax=Alteriqipengyuania flavescens TaxID=3053610 RepID=UPI0025B4AB52|nr:glycosyltransferase [Alteriqipengyuania flavescens]WJY17826.1 glycosyltransferase [Alteriqipengyuania flavescens]WJY23768.1 glycosyltransferase [Alteriqipengyuania flavescens]